MLISNSSEVSESRSSREARTRKWPRWMRGANRQMSLFVRDYSRDVASTPRWEGGPGESVHSGDAQFHPKKCPASLLIAAVFRPSPGCLGDGLEDAQSIPLAAPASEARLRTRTRRKRSVGSQISTTLPPSACPVDD